MTGGCETEVVFLKRGQKVQSLINALNPLIFQRAYQSFLPIKLPNLMILSNYCGLYTCPKKLHFTMRYKRILPFKKTILKTNINKLCLHVSSLFRFFVLFVSFSAKRKQLFETYFCVKADKLVPLNNTFEPSCALIRSNLF